MLLVCAEGLGQVKHTEEEEDQITWQYKIRIWMCFFFVPSALLECETAITVNIEQYR